MPAPAAAASTAPASPAAQPLCFADILAAEFEAVTGEASPSRIGPPDLPALTDAQRIACVREAYYERGTSALCLSGGGIRSASFALGVVQALGKKGLLGKFDYLSTVSGGGYVGSLVAAWIYRSSRGIDDVESGFANPGSCPADPVNWLRTYLSYLAPRRGLFSIDTWTLFVTYVRNLSLNALILLPTLALVMLVPFVVASTMDNWIALAMQKTWADWLGALVLFLGFVFIATATRSLRVPDSERWAFGIPLGNVDIQAMLVLGAYGIIFGWVLLHAPIDQPFWLESERALTSELPVATRAALEYKALALFVFAWALLDLSGTMDYIKSPRLKLPARIGIVIATLACGAVTSLIAYGVLQSLTPLDVPFDEPAWRRLLTLAPPGLLAAVGAGEILFVGALSRVATDYDREWSARAGAWTSMLGAGWLLLFGISFYGPGALRDIAEKGIPPTVIYALLGGVGAAIARFAFRMDTGPQRDGRMAWLPSLRDRGVDAFAALFILALLVGIANLVDLAVHNADAWLPADWSSTQRALKFTASGVLAVALVLMGIAALAGFCVNINKFSLHAMYRDRLIRTFLGASRARHEAPTHPLDEEWNEPKQFEPREPNRFTGFDKDDNPPLHWLAPRRDPTVRNSRKQPFLLVNAALNLLGGRNLAWQQRKAASFTFSPIHSGSGLVGYRPTCEFSGKAGGLTLGTAMATSGAAVSPNAGYTSSPLRTFLLALFNARLGWWLGNPADLNAVRQNGPRMAILPMLRELLGLTNERGSWLFVSDGGHFDNLGLYEAIQRGCRYVVVVDASCDPDRNFDDLGNAIRKIRIDLGVQIDREEGWRIGGREMQAQGRYCALLPIRYDLAWGAPKPGFLLYIKAALYTQAPWLPIDVLQYGGRASPFPHEPTTDQFFTEAQFESYRALGEFELDAITAYQPRVGSVVDLIDLGGQHARIDRMAARRQT